MFAHLTLDRLDQEIAELAAHIAAATCRWLELIAEIDSREGYTHWGFGSCSAWLSWRCSLAPTAARDHVRVARRIAELPRTKELFAEGALTFSKVRALTRVATPENEDELLVMARHMTAAQLERTVRLYRGVLRTQATPPADEPRSYLSCTWNDEGELEVRGRLPADEGAVVVKALECARDHLLEQEGPELEAPPSNADALGLMADALLANGPHEGAAGERYQVLIHVDEAALRDDADEARCELDGSAVVAPETVRRIACDTALVSIIERDGRPLSVGRRTRSIPPAMRRALNSRDGGCRFPGCAQHRFVDAHHIEHWAHGGETKLSNLVQLCRRHHRLLHEGGFSVERCGNGLRFRRPNGDTLPAVPRARRGDHATVVTQNRRRGVRPNGDSCFPLSAGEHFDYGMAIDALIQSDGLWERPPPAA